MQNTVFPSSTDLLNRSWDRIKDQLPLTAGLTLVFVMGTAGLGSLEYIGWLLGGFVNAGYIACLLKIRGRTQFDFADFLWAFRNMNRFINVILATLLKTILIVAGFICLIIPGIYLSVATSLTDVVLVKQDLDGVSAIKKSMSLIKGHWWSMASLLFVVLLLNLVGILCLLVGILVTIPLSILILVEAVEILDKATVSAGPSSSFVAINPV